MQNHRPRILAIALLIAGAISLVCFGIVGKGRGGVANKDGRVLYAAGSTWLQHGNPYDHDALQRSVVAIPGMDLSDSGFFYPPQASAICVALGLLPYDSARILWLLVNLAALGTLIALCAVMVRSNTGELPEDTDGFAIPLVAAVILGNPFTCHVLWMGQTTLVAVAALMGTWFYTARKNWPVAGLCLGLASYKPQIAILVVLWLLLEKDWRTLVMSASTAAVMALYPMVTQGGPVGALRAWYAGISSDYALPFNLPTFSHKIGIDSLWVAMGGVSLPHGAIMGTSLLLTVILWRFRRRFDRADILALLMIVTLTFSVYLHDYDYVALIPAFASLWTCARTRAGAGYAAASVFMLVMLFLPQRFVSLLDIPFLDQWRTFIVVLIGALILYAGGATRRPEAGSEISLGLRI